MPSRRNCWMTSRESYNLPRSFVATPYPQLGWGMGRLLVNVGSSVLASFLR
jgi:hypothetical protein